MWSDQNLKDVLAKGGVAVMPTDTLYGMVGSALSQAAVERIYQLRKRSPQKPCIVLMADIKEMEKFSINLSEEQRVVIQNCWPGPVSMVIDCSNEKFSYLTRGTGTLAFRVPADEELRELLASAGPLVAPSANPEGQTPAYNIQDAKNYFGNSVDLYIDGGKIFRPASKVIRLYQNGRTEVLRP